MRCHIVASLTDKTRLNMKKKKEMRTTLKTGKYAGQAFSVMPTDYLEYIKTEAEATLPAIREELKKRMEGLESKLLGGAAALHPKEKHWDSGA